MMPEETLFINQDLTYDISVESIGLSCVALGRVYKMQFLTIQNHLNQKGTTSQLHPISGLIYRFKKILQQIIFKKLRKEIA